MKRFVLGTISAAALALAVGACDDTSGGYDYPASNVDCTAYASCGACTPVVGCGWCFNGGGQGTCASSPDSCTGSQFSWTWEPTGCRVPADASAGGADAGSDAAVDAAAEAAADAAKEAAAIDAPNE